MTLFVAIQLLVDVSTPKYAIFAFSTNEDARLLGFRLKRLENVPKRYDPGGRVEEMSLGLDSPAKSTVLTTPLAFLGILKMCSARLAGAIGMMEWDYSTYKLVLPSRRPTSFGWLRVLPAVLYGTLTRELAAVQQGKYFRLSTVRCLLITSYSFSFRYSRALWRDRRQILSIANAVTATPIFNLPPVMSIKTAPTIPRASIDTMVREEGPSSLARGVVPCGVDECQSARVGAHFSSFICDNIYCHVTAAPSRRRSGPPRIRAAS
ncbi:hypothetical protein MVEN_01766200 [Mycena venus]|uniref:Uncharacterized protein n=1 Tax=Mycena venus TaxID=2733690 RepID=A0A8H6XMZ4_9AGAR|nr:hypothetical protein MVEN_01766200 [Mycena venus]